MTDGFISPATEDLKTQKIQSEENTETRKCRFIKINLKEQKPVKGH